MTVCEEIGSWAAGLSAADLPAAVSERADLQAASIAAGVEAGRDAAAPFVATAPGGEPGEVYASAAASVAHDWDDYLFMGHTGHSAVPAARAFAGAEPERSLVAQVAANEVAGRLGAALFLGPHNGQFWSSIHCAGAAVAAGIGIGLGSERLAHALAIALYQPPYGLWPGFMGPETKLLTAAEPGAQGVRAAMLAADGVNGALDVIENPRGLLVHFSFAPQPAMLGGLGRVWLTETLAFKPYPGCAYMQAVADAALTSGLAAEEVDSIEVSAGFLTCEMERLGTGEELTPVRVNFSAALSAAAALIGGRLTHEELRPAWLAEHEAEIRDLAGRITVRHDWRMTAETLAGTVDAGAGLGGLSRRDWRRVGRRSRELNMGVIPDLGELRELAGDRMARRELLAVLRRALGRRASMDSIDTAAMRLRFPARLAIRKRSGEVVAVEGRELGACGEAISDQREIVERKARICGVGEAAIA